MTTLERPQPLLSMAEKAARIDAICAKARILPVITIAREQDILPLADALAAGGIRTLEVTLRSEHGLKAIQVLREQRPELCVGAGTVLDRSMFAAVEAAGAQFVVTPGITPDILQAGVDSDIPLLPGISTPSEIMLGYALGYRRCKLFPAEISGGVAAIKAFGGPFGDIRFCPTGGVNPANVRNYMALPNVMCVGGTWMLDSSWIKNGDWARIEACSAEAMALLDCSFSLCVARLVGRLVGAPFFVLGKPACRLTAFAPARAAWPSALAGACALDWWRSLPYRSSKRTLDHEQ